MVQRCVMRSHRISPSPACFDSLNGSHECVSWLILGFAIVANAGAHLILKWGQVRVVPLGFSIMVGGIRADGALLMGGVLFACSLVFYSHALARLPVSIAYPMLVNGALFLILVGSMLLFDERLTVLRGIGLAFLVVGLVFLR